LRSRIHPSARIVDSILWDDVEVGADAVIEECIVTDGATVAAGATHSRCVISQGDDGSPLRVD
jgi:ADP-glucose pyrophosphorylase